MYPDDDPRSWNYKRTYERPDPHLGRGALCVLLAALASAGVYSLARWVLRLSPLWCALAAAATPVAALLIFLGPAAIWLVRLYQRYAPISVRSMCRYEPSCSQYMILAIKKYGPYRGIPMGIRRIRRCGHKQGGFDYP